MKKLVVACAALALGACSAQPQVSRQEVASLSTPGRGAAPTSAVQEERPRERLDMTPEDIEALFEPYKRCLGEHGVDKKLAPQPHELLDKANKACGSKRPLPPWRGTPSTRSPSTSPTASCNTCGVRASATSRCPGGWVRRASALRSVVPTTTSSRSRSVCSTRRSVRQRRRRSEPTVTYVLRGEISWDVTSGRFGFARVTGMERRGFRQSGTRWRRVCHAPDYVECGHSSESGARRTSVLGCRGGLCSRATAPGRHRNRQAPRMHRWRGRWPSRRTSALDMALRRFASLPFHGAECKQGA